MTDHGGFGGELKRLNGCLWELAITVALVLGFLLIALSSKAAETDDRLARLEAQQAAQPTAHHRPVR